MSTVEGSRPYAWPFGGAVVAERTALVVAGADAGWYGQCPDAAQVARVVRHAAKVLRSTGVLVVRVRHLMGPDALPPAWTGPAADREVDARGRDAFFATPLDGILRKAGRDHLVLGGFGLEGPVHSTLRSANDRGYECITLTDGTASVRRDLESAAHSMICMSGGIFGAVGDSEALLRAFDRTITPREVQ